MHERLWHAMVSIRIEGIGEVGRGRDYGRRVGGDEFGGGYGLGRMHGIRRGED
jgi:hypothetical protein